MVNAQIEESLTIGADGKPRCWWCGADPLYMQYHDTEWGRPVHDDTRLFEKICLEGFQSGLSWITILRRREGFRKAFAKFNIKKVASFSQEKINQLVVNPDIIRHRGKIEATINNAARAIELQQEFGSLASYFWQYASEESPMVADRSEIPATTPKSLALSKDLKRRGWKFVGPTTCYAFMQSMGLVNDHIHGCHVKI